MSSFIDNLEKWFDSLPEKEFLESWDKSTAGMRSTNHYVDFFSDLEFEFEFECNALQNSEDKYLIDQSNLPNHDIFYTPDQKSGVFIFSKIWTKLLMQPLV